jgi:acyl-CoA thioesterase I
MARHLCRIAAVIFLAGWTWGCDERLGSPPPKIQGTSVDARPGAKAPPPSNAATRPEEHILVAFGNSLTAGLGVTADETYPAQLQQKLLLAGYRYRVVNAGISGETTAGGLRRVGWVLKSKPDVVILELGANDGLRGLDLKQTQDNLGEIISQLLAGGAKVLLAGMQLPSNYGPQYTSRFQHLYVDLARRYGVPIIPFFLQGVAAQTNLNQADGIHPTVEGYAVVVETLWPALEPLLKR